jgi:fibrillarin-like pre-rRNA processing protein
VTTNVKEHEKYHGVYWITLEDRNQRLATKNLTPGRRVYGERLIQQRNAEYRIWDPYRSKLAASILKGLESMPIRRGQKILYLGSASGTTASHVSDIVNQTGHVYCVDFAPRSMRELLDNVCSFRSNVTPILNDARIPEAYSTFVKDVDGIYCDVAQPQQAKILADNADLYLHEGCWSMLAVKSQSIDVTKRPSEIYRREAKILENRGFTVEEMKLLEPYEKAHAMIVSLLKKSPRPLHPQT